MRSLFLPLILSILLGQAACTKDQNFSIVVYDSIPQIINTSEKFLYSFRMGYLTLDTLIPLAFERDSMSIHLKISDYKSGYAFSFLQGSDTTSLSPAPLQTNYDTLIRIVKTDTLLNWGFFTYKFTGNFSVEILPWKTP
ncbi:MAG: hypothetical protein ACP5O2_09925 [Bacteroidales bacterium]